MNTGEVVGGTAGPQEGDYTVSGDAVNVAARLQQTAAPGEILVGGMTRRLSSDAFAFAPLDEMALKGRTEPIEAWRLERELPERPRMHGGEARLVGRQRELASLESALEEAREGRGLMVALVGEPGIGKSRLALEMRQRAEAAGFTTAWTSSRSYASAFPYHLVSQLASTSSLDRAPGQSTADALRSAEVTADDDALGRWAAVLDEVLGEGQDDDPQLADLSPSGRQRILVHAIGGLLKAASQREPMLVVLDDLHWADPASLAVVEELLDILPGLRVVLMATYRSNWSHGWEGRSAYEQLNLRALRPEDAREMAEELAAGRSVPAELTERVLERSAGNPLFLEELLHGERGGTDGQPHRLPATIHEMLLARLDGLPPEATADPAARIGRGHGVPGGHGRRAVRVGPRRDRCGPSRPPARGARRCRRPRAHARLPPSADPRGRLRQPPPQHAAGAARSDRCAGSRSTAARSRSPSSRATTATATTRPRRGPYLRLAGERASALNANREAYGWFIDAAEAFADDPLQRAEMIEAAAQQRYLLGEINEPTTSSRKRRSRLYESVGAERAALNARRWLGRFRWLLGDKPESKRQIDLAIDGLERLGPSPELAMAYSFRSQSVMLEPDFDAGEKWARKAIEIARADRCHGRPRACLQQPRVVPDLARRPRGRRLPAPQPRPGDRAPPPRRRRSRLRQPQRAGPAHLPVRRTRSPRRCLVEGVEYSARTIPDGVFDRWIRSGWGEFLLVTGRWAEAEPVIFGIDPDAAEAYLGSEVRSLRAHLLAWRGRYEEAVRIAAARGRDVGPHGRHPGGAAAAGGAGVRPGGAR